MNCTACGHPVTVHGDRAIFPACEGGVLPTSWLDNKEICDCKGFRGE